MRHCFPVLALSTLLTYSGAASAGNEAAAQRLFEEGRALDAAGRWQAACTKYRGSMKLDASVGTLLNIAACHEREGSLAKALSDYERAIVLNRATPGEERRANVEAYTREQIASLAPRVPSLTITIDNRPASGLRVWVGDQEIPVEALGSAIPSDPGDVHVRASAGSLSAEEKFTLPEGTNRTITLRLTEESKSAEPPPPEPPMAEAAVPTWSWISGAFGVAFAGAAVGFAVDYAITVDELEQQCGPNFDMCPQLPDPFDPTPLNQRKNLDMGLGIGFAAASAVALTAAVVGAATAGPAATSVTPWFAPTAAGVRLQTRF